MIIDLLIFFYFSFTRHSTENITKKFMDAFNNESVIDECRFFRYTRKKNYKNTKIIFKRVIEQIKDILIKIETDKYEELKRFILETQIQSFKDVSFFYFETFVVIRSIQRILNINENKYAIECMFTKKQMMKLHKNIINVTNHNLRYPTHRRSECFYEKVILFEFACIYLDTTNIMKIISKKYLKSYISDLNTAEHHSDAYFFQSILYATKEKYFIDYARNTIYSILEIDKQQPICVITSSNGLTRSIKCLQEFTKTYMPNKYTILDENEEKQELDNRDTKRDNVKQFNIDYILDKPLVYEKKYMVLFITLIHYHSVINNVEYKYEFNFTEDKLYKVQCSKNDIKKELKSYYLKKDIPNDCKVKTIHKFSAIIDFKQTYSTLKPDDSSIEPINTRVIKISCGHLLGLELIDEWFSMFPKLKCCICMVDVSILGSFDTDVYKY